MLVAYLESLKSQALRPFSRKLTVTREHINSDTLKNFPFFYFPTLVSKNITIDF